MGMMQRVGSTMDDANSSGDRRVDAGPWNEAQEGRDIVRVGKWKGNTQSLATLHRRASLLNARLLCLLAVLHHVPRRLLAREARRGALDAHVGLAERKGVDVRPRVEVREGVVDEAVRGLVGAHGVDDVEERRVRAQAPVVDRDRGRRHICPLGHAARLDVGDQVRAVARVSGARTRESSGARTD